MKSAVEISEQNTDQLELGFWCNVKVGLNVWVVQSVFQVKCMCVFSECCGVECIVYRSAVKVGWGQVGQGHASQPLLQLCTNLLSTSNTMDTLCSALQKLETSAHLVQTQY